MKKILVTGGAGFIGSHLVDYLINNNHEVIVLDNLSQGDKLSNNAKKNIKFIKGDIRDESLVNKITKGCNYIYHFAAVLGVEIVANNHKKTMDIEAAGMKNIADAAIKNNIEKIVYASTSGVYGKSFFEKSVTEDFNVDPVTSYAVAKRYNEIYLKAIWKQYQISSLAIRYFNVYGPKQDDRMVIPRFFFQAKENKPITIFGDGKQTRDFTFIDDAIKRTFDIVEKTNKGSEIFNICGDNEYTIKNVAKKIKHLCNSSSKIITQKVPSNRNEFEVQRRTGSSIKINQFIGDYKYIDLNIGLKLTKDYLEK